MSALSALEQALYNVAKSSLPRYLFQEDAAAQEVLAAFAKLFAPIWVDLELRIDDTFLAEARTEALYQHAKDRGTRPQTAELDEALVYRLRFLREDAVTLTALRDRATAILQSYAITIPAGYPAIAELRRDRAFCARGRAKQINAVAKASLVDGETFTCDGTIYEFDVAGDGVTPGHQAVNVSTDTTAADVATRMATALEPQYPTEVSVIGTDTVRMVGAGTVTETVAAAGFKIWDENAYCSRGYRVTGDSRAGTVIVVMLPFGTTAACAATVAEAMRQAKAGGVKVIVERRLNP